MKRFKALNMAVVYSYIFLGPYVCNNNRLSLNWAAGWGVSSLGWLSIV